MIILSEVNQTEEDKYHIITVIHGMEFLINDTNALIHKAETDLQILKTNLQIPRGNILEEGYIGSLG